jgi:ATP-dependent Clp protease ATP-binding subunit ClpA
MPFATDRLQAMQRQQHLETALAVENTFKIDHTNASKQGLGLQSRFSFDTRVIEDLLRANIIGQEPVIQNVLNMLRVVRTDISDPRKPLASMLFCGPTGVGKTETVRTIARALYGDADAMCRIDMNTLAQEHYAASFTGAPPGYVGSKEGMTVLDQEKIEGTRNLPGIVLFDEMEKASNEVMLALLNVFDNGLLTVASGERTFSFRNAIIFMSSNIGARELAELYDQTPGLIARLFGHPRARPSQAHDIVMKCLLERFPPEFVNRIDHIDTFQRISHDTVPALVDIELGRLNQRLAKHGISLRISENIRSYLANRGYDRQFGARGLRRAMRRHLEFPLAKFILDEINQEKLLGNSTYIQANLNNGAVRFSITSKP